jgi:hypothetical protein
MERMFTAYLDSRPLLRATPTLDPCDSRKSSRIAELLLPAELLAVDCPLATPVENSAYWEMVDEASWESFPCSDPPVHTLPRRSGEQPTAKAIVIAETAEGLICLEILRKLHPFSLALPPPPR